MFTGASARSQSLAGPTLSDPVRQHLQTSLGPGYTLERELGGGGMSRVFVARDQTLGRDVVVKVLAHELAAGLSAERFTHKLRLCRNPSAKWHLRSAEIRRFLCPENPCRNQSFSAWNNGIIGLAEYRSGR